MKKKIILALTCALSVVTIATAAAPAMNTQAASTALTNGTVVDAIPIAGWVAAGTTANVMVLDTAIGQFQIKLDSTTNFGTTKYLSAGEIVVVDIYAGNDAAFHAAKFELNSVNQNVTGAVEVGASKVTTTTTTTTTTTNTASSTANTVMVTGSVDANSTTETLYLSTSDGTMVIKLDASTDMSEGKVILPGYNYNVYIYNGGDGYNHAAKVKDLSGKSLYSSNGLGSSQVTVSGTVMSTTTQNVLYLSTAGGDMTIRLDNASDTSACHVLRSGQKITATVVGSTDGYLHAVKLVDDATANKTTEGSMGDNGKLTGQKTMTLAGSPTSDSTDDVLYFNTNGEIMKLRLDSGTTGTNTAAIRPGYSYSADVYYGSDSYYHIASITNTSGHNAGNGSNVNTNNALTITGTIEDDTTNAMLKLKLSDGTIMQIKLDTTTNVSSCRILRTNRKITVTCGHGSDGYWHAVKLDKAN